jgi:hypothetical protein
VFMVCTLKISRQREGGILCSATTPSMELGFFPELGVVRSLNHANTKESSGNIKEYIPVVLGSSSYIPHMHRSVNS